jgi:hypothetical protein
MLEGNDYETSFMHTFYCILDLFMTTMDRISPTQVAMKYKKHIIIILVQR